LAEVKEELEKIVKKLVVNAVSDLEHQKKKISKKVGKVIAARELEVDEAKEIIKGLENISQNQQNKIKDLREKSDREIKSLQTEIGILLNRLKEYEKKKVEDCEGQLEREKTRLEADLEAKEDELARKMKIANDQQRKLNGEIRE